MLLPLTFSFVFIAMLGMGTVADVMHPAIQVEAESIFSSNDTINADAATEGEAGKIINSIYKAANLFAGIVLAISIIMIILGGLKYIMANGDPRQAEAGKMIIIYSGIGIVIALLRLKEITFLIELQAEARELFTCSIRTVAASQRIRYTKGLSFALSIEKILFRLLKKKHFSLIVRLYSRLS